MLLNGWTCCFHRFASAQSPTIGSYEKQASFLFRGLPATVLVNTNAAAPNSKHPYGQPDWQPGALAACLRFHSRRAMNATIFALGLALYRQYAATNVTDIGNSSATSSCTA